ncbi:MAG: glycosyltransferase [Chloroflexota bacterium]
MGRALVVYSRVGGGHLSAARALESELKAQGYSARLVDAYVECGRLPLPLFPTLYARLARSHPHLWSLIYHGSDTRFAPRRTVAPFLRRGLARLMEEERPDLVISVLPVVNGLLADAAARVGARLEVVLTDWNAVHRFWVARGVNHYTAPTESARQDCIRFGAPPEAVDVVGIPVRAEFTQTGEDPGALRQVLFSEVHLPATRFTVLAMVGAEGSPRALRNVSQLVNLDLDAQVIAICGHNGELRRRLAALPGRVPIRTLGFVENVAEWMRASDVLLTKAGGVTLAEAFSVGAAVVVHDVLGGQEDGNLEYVRRQGAVEVVHGPDDLRDIIGRFIDGPAAVVALAARGSELARPEAAHQIVANVLRRHAARHAAA